MGMASGKICGVNSMYEYPPTDEEIVQFEKEFRNERISCCIFGIIVGIVLLGLLWM